jgi:hypothetical protein
VSEQIDFIGGGANLSPKPSKTIANQRPTVAEEKAELCLRIGVLCRKPPACVANGSIQTTREWIAAMNSAMATAKKVRASVPELTAAISSMERFK